MSEPATVRALKSLPPGNAPAFASVLIVRKAAAKLASNGNPFLSLELGDRTGSFNCTVFNDNPAFEALKSAGEGAVVRVEGKVEYYQGRLAPRLSKVSLLDEAALAAPGVLENLIETAPESAEALWSEFQALAEGIGHPGLRETVRGVFAEIGEEFRTAPAAVMMHHAYRHGLLEHTVHMARVAKAVLPLYPEVDADLAMAGILLHDIGKTIEYVGALAPRRGRSGILQGHVVLGYRLVRQAGLKAKLDADRLERLEHIILSHQGELAWGAAALAATPEAVFVSLIDNLDAKMGMVQRALRQAAEGDEFSEKLLGLNAPLLTKPPSS